MMNDLAARLSSELAAARAAIWSSYSRFWREPERLTADAEAGGHDRQAGCRGDTGDAEDRRREAGSADR
jgi:hypothetical protein